MIAKLATVEQIKAVLADGQSVALKYVRVKGQYRFVFLNVDYIPEHKDMVDPGEEIESAAFVIAYGDDLQVQGKSMSLRVGEAADDLKLLKELLL